jgi:hypothetical protein
MPIEYQIDPELGLVFSQFEGYISAQDLEGHWRRLLADPAAPDPLALAADVGDSQLLVDGEDLQRLVRTVIEPLLGDRRWRFAIIASSPAQYGIAKQFMHYTGQCGQTETFRDMDAAIAWLVEEAGLAGGGVGTL